MGWNEAYAKYTSTCTPHAVETYQRGSFSQILMEDSFKAGYEAKEKESKPSPYDRWTTSLERGLLRIDAHTLKDGRQNVVVTEDTSAANISRFKFLVEAHNYAIGGKKPEWEKAFDVWILTEPDRAEISVDVTKVVRMRSCFRTAWEAAKKT